MDEATGTESDRIIDLLSHNGPNADMSGLLLYSRETLINSAWRSSLTRPRAL
jgi:hypothetical protein